MELYIKKISSLEKIRSFENDYKVAPDNIKLLGGEHYAYQLVITTADISAKVNVSIDSDIKEYINIYSVSDVPMDRVTHDSPTDDNYITKNRICKYGKFYFLRDFYMKIKPLTTP